MGPQLLLRLLLLSSLPPTVFGATTAPYVDTTPSYNTECKACPHVLCPNTLLYTLGDALNTTCWTRGTRIIDTSLWLRTASSCYVTEHDLADNTTDYASSLPYCGPHSEDEDLMV